MRPAHNQPAVVLRHLLREDMRSKPAPVVPSLWSAPSTLRSRAFLIHASPATFAVVEGNRQALGSPHRGISILRPLCFHSDFLFSASFYFYPPPKPEPLSAIASSLHVPRYTCPSTFLSSSSTSPRLPKNRDIRMILRWFSSSLLSSWGGTLRSFASCAFASVLVRCVASWSFADFLCA
jgi:hypothetical protein